jgi:HAD superfamily hydrolase (TIGR01509 family)
MLPRPIALLWDNDGVLVDTEGLYFRATRDVLATVGIDLDEGLYLQLFLREGRGAFHLARERGLDETQIDGLRRARDGRYAELLQAGSLLFAGVEEVVSGLARRYRMAIVTSSLREHFEVIHRSTQLLHHFELVLTHGDYARAKPDPDPYLMALARLGLPAEACLVIEDSERGLRAARAAGVRCWVVPSRLASEGAFGEAERVFGSLAELAAALGEGAEVEDGTSCARVTPRTVG